MYEEYPFLRRRFVQVKHESRNLFWAALSKRHQDKRERGARMNSCWELEPDRIVLECYQCGELVIVLGGEENWCADENIFFECWCGQRLMITSGSH